MRVTPSTVLQNLLRRHPEVEDSLGWYGITITPAEAQLTLGDLCADFDLDLEDVLTDLQAVLDEDDDDDDDEYDDDDDSAYTDPWTAEEDEDNYDDDYDDDDDDEPEWSYGDDEDDSWIE